MDSSKNLYFIQVTNKTSDDHDDYTNDWFNLIDKTCVYLKHQYQMGFNKDGLIIRVTDTIKGDMSVSVVDDVLIFKENDIEENNNDKDMIFLIFAKALVQTFIKNNGTKAKNNLFDLKLKLSDKIIFEYHHDSNEYKDQYEFIENAKTELEDEDDQTEYYDSSSSENSPKILNPQNNWDLKDYDDWELEC